MAITTRTPGDDFHFAVRIPAWLLAAVILGAVLLLGVRGVLSYADSPSGPRFASPVRVETLTGEMVGQVWTATVRVESTETLASPERGWSLSLGPHGGTDAVPVAATVSSTEGGVHTLRLFAEVPAGREPVGVNFAWERGAASAEPFAEALP